MSDSERIPARDQQRERLLRELAADIVVDEAEKAAAGLRRLTVLHGLRPDQRAELDELIEFVEDVCHQHHIETKGGIATASYPIGQHPRGTRWTRWLFAPPTAVADLATVRAAVHQRWPDWPIEADEY
jgi:hypothetical protein